MMGWNKRAERAETNAMFWEEEYHAQRAEIERLNTHIANADNRHQESVSAYLREIERLRAKAGEHT